MKRFALLCALLLATLALATSPVGAGQVLDAVHARGALLVGTTGDYKPFTFRTPDGAWQGADIDMARRLAERLGVRVEFVPTTWSKLNDDFAAGRFDLAMGGVTNLPARAAMGPFSRTVFVDGKRPIARCAERERFASVAAIDQPAVRLVVNPGGTNEQFVHASLPHASLTVFPDNATVFDEIAAGRQDVMVTDGIEVDHQAALHKGVLCAAAVPAPFTKLEKAYWIRRDAELEAAVAAWLDAEIASGAWQRTLANALEAP